jgi:hypothetical protein
MLFSWLYFQAIYVFCIVPNFPSSETTFSNMTFTLDSHLVGRFAYTPTNSTKYLYNVPVYTKTSLDNVLHNLVVEAQAGTHSSYLAFDYAIYT